MDLLDAKLDAAGKMEAVASTMYKLSQEADIHSDPLMCAKHVLELVKGFEEVKD